MPPHSEDQTTQPTLVIQEGTCFVLLAYDIGLFVNLNECERRITMSKERQHIRRRRRAPKHFEYQPLPLRVTRQTRRIRIAGFETSADVDMMLYDFGALTIAYRIPIAGPFDALLKLSEELYDHESLLADSQLLARELLDVIGPAVASPHLSDTSEDYCVYEITSLQPAMDIEALRKQYAPEIAQVLRADSEILSPMEIEEAHQCRIAFTPQDLVIIDWNAALIFDSEPQDVRAVMEFANVELLELRCLDEQLDDALERAHRAMIRRGRRFRWPGSRLPELDEVAMMQVDSALLFEGINNALKLLGDQYLARVYRLASQRFHLKEWDDSILRKINTLESIYEKISNNMSNMRLELLEWIIIILIAISIGISLLPTL